MWELRAIRVVTLFAGVVAAVVGSGCCSDGAWRGLGGTPNPHILDSVPAELISAGKAKEEDETPKNWKTWWFDDQPSHLTPERIKGGIY